MHGKERMYNKKSNRAEYIQEELSKTGIKVEVEGNTMLIEGGKVSGAFVNSHNDHRIAMMAAVVALGSEGPVMVADAECVAKSYPGFFNDLSESGVRVEETAQ